MDMDIILLIIIVDIVTTVQNTNQLIDIKIIAVKQVLNISLNKN